MKKNYHYIMNFGIKLFLLKMWKALFVRINMGWLPNDRVYTRYHGAVLNFLEEKFSDFIQGFKEELPKERLQDIRPYIWILWLQGESKAPKIVQKCIASVRAHAGDAKVVVLDETSIREYIQLPKHIEEKYADGHISKVKLSDIVRLSLLYQYGGLWADATIFVTGRIDDNVFKDFFTIRHLAQGQFVSKGRWTGFLMGGAKGNPLFKFALELHFRYFDKFGCEIDYLLLDYFIELGCRTFPWMNEMMDSVVSSNPRIYDLMEVINEVFDKQQFTNIISDTIFHKLSWKKEVKNRQGDTYYKYLANLY